MAPVIEEVAFFDPACCLPGLSGEAHLSFIDSAAPSQRLGRYSFLSFSPFGIFKVTGGIAHWNDEPLDGRPFPALKTLLERFPLSPSDDGLPPFRGGAMGYIAYEAGALLERLPKLPISTKHGPEMVLPFYDVVLAIDHFAPSEQGTTRPRSWVISTGFPAEDSERGNRAKERLDWFIKRLETARQAHLPQSPPAIRGWCSNLSRPAFKAAVERTREYIRNGDIFQANITQRFSAPLPDAPEATPLAYYLSLRTHNAAPFAAYLDCGDHVVASTSPERFLTLDTQGNVETRPIKGTAPRILDDPAKDRAEAEQLAKSEKDRAENTMITDLMRNDLSRVCRAGTIKVPELCCVESYARVHHLVSTVTAEMKPGLGAVALIGATFPGGSITGAPKIRAMEIITELEQLPRRVYCGSIGYIGFDGAMDMNIAIRTMLFEEGRAQFNAGGGMTILSDPDAEYEESLHKAAAIFKALGTSVEDERYNLETSHEGDQEDGTAR
ncbi:para-aminobenzoate synthetase component 1 [Cohaesibacter sp. ES.047]|uniref:aminodeoxychorismate synthase component I n=1 Tax=Cohaesibacter sp. ES.047 TaxID=1798205 RepID=UPI000BB86947|nr:aminodeoxychorismate synthase component I [Cohaesibacter sp. ES.047]SNY93859.1 para-aminobenzoate synthetase component 1 [Cohaesibacter sp. ES.047]